MKQEHKEIKCKNVMYINIEDFDSKMLKAV